MNLEDLSDEELIKGIQKSYTNAVNLLDEAYLLGQAEKFSRGYTLCQISIEEFAKCPLLFGLLMERLEKSEIDYEKFKADDQWDGLKGYITNSRLSAKNVIQNYNQLWHIERAFQISKADLKIRPIYHRNKNRIESHVCIAFVAYTI